MSKLLLILIGLSLAACQPDNDKKTNAPVAATGSIGVSGVTLYETPNDLINGQGLGGVSVNVTTLEQDNTDIVCIRFRTKPQKCFLAEDL